MNIVILGLSITSAWGNGHATTFRALCQALYERGHSIVFFEKNVEWYEHNRDLPDPPYCKVRVFESWQDIIPAVRRALAEADVAVLGSYFPDGIAAAELIANSSVPVKAFYDIDTPITVAKLRSEGATEYLRSDQVPLFDVYFSFTGGPILQQIEEEFGSPMAVPLYCSFDPQRYHRFDKEARFECDLSYMGTYAVDRQPKIDVLLRETAQKLPGRKFLVAGSQYPDAIDWPKNVERIVHLNPQFHAQFYSSSRMTLNVTRRDMVMAGYSPSVRLFEAAACGACILSDNWAGLEQFFVAGKEILLPQSSEEVVAYVTGTDESELRRIGDAAQTRVMAEHTSSRRAQQLEGIVRSGLKQARGMRIAI
ncbi:MAG: glycosyltransferase [Acidobacteriaceae bacterium]